jgi:hypothetical protein
VMAHNRARPGRCLPFWAPQPSWDGSERPESRAGPLLGRE